MASSAKTFNATSSRKNATDHRLFVAICKLDAVDLKIYLNEVLRKYYPDTTEIGDGYLYAKGTLPVLLTAHMDTVHKELVNDFYEHKTSEGMTIISSPQGIGGDDRCGIYMILQILTTTELRPSILFCEDEEVGGIGSDKFCQTEFIKDLESMKFLIELDRANAFDAVFYDDDNQDFHEWIEAETGYKESWGTFSDISNLSPACGVSSVNFSCGYYNAHTTNEFVVVEEMENTTEMVKLLLQRATEEDVEQFKYVESVYKFNRYYTGYNYGGWGDWGDNGWTVSNYHESKETTYPRKKIMEVYFIDHETSKETVWSKEVSTEDEGWASFFFACPDVCMNDIYDYDFYSRY